MLLLAALGLLWQESAEPPDGGRHVPNRKAEAPLVTTTERAARLDLQTFDSFSLWLDRLSQGGAVPSAGLVAEGLRLARQRRSLMQELIRTDPKRALEYAVTLDVWHRLPQELRLEVEEPFSLIADFQVLPVCLVGSPDAALLAVGKNLPEAVWLTRIDGQPPLESHVFGRRTGLSTKEKSPVQGIRLGGRAALCEEVLHALESREIAIAEAIYPSAGRQPDRDFATGEPLGDNAVTALGGGRIFRFSDSASLAAFNASLAELDNMPGPHSGASVLFMPSLATGDGEEGGFDLNGAITMSDVQASSWTETKKSVFMIRCDFSDVPNSTSPVVDATTYGTLLNTTVSDRIRDFSHGKTWIEASVSTTITRLPKTAAYYAKVDSGGSSLNSQLLADAKTRYLTANPGVNFDNYQIVGVWIASIGMKISGLTYGGLATLGGADLWIQGTTEASVHVHELGHNYGLGHASFWAPPPASFDPVDPAGTSDEYGDPFDVMGKGPVPEGAFHAEAKQRLNWLAEGDWTDASAGGNETYRIYRIDHKDTGGSKGLRVTRGTDDYYWVNYRKSFDNNWLQAGANIVWKRPEQTRSWLIDTTPGSLAGIDDRTDGSIPIGYTYSDSTANLHITPLARGGTTPNEYLEVRVNQGPFPGNTAPSVTLSGPSAILARQTCVFTATATDGNGDALAYAWDFGLGFTFDNNPCAACLWNKAGTYTVKVRVSDMKGLSTQATKTVTVTDPLDTWSNRTNSSSGDFKVLVASPTKVLAAGENFVTYRGPLASSPDGMTWTAIPLPDYQQIYGGAWDGSQFLLAGLDWNNTIAAWVGWVSTSPTGNAGTWTRRVFGGSPLRGIACGGGAIVAVGEGGTILRSTNGIAWSAMNSGVTNVLSGVAYGGGRFVAVGYDYCAGGGNCTVLTSADGISWTNTSVGAGVQSWQDLRYVAWAKDRFLASGWYGEIRHSVDLGTSFTTNRNHQDDMPGLAYGNGVWFAAGVSGKQYVDGVFTGTDIDLFSTDGVNWLPSATPCLADRNAAIFFNNTFITAGDDHSIRQSASINPSGIGYWGWRENFFPDRGTSSTPNGDCDGDGMINLLEYSLGCSPLSPAGSDGLASLPQALVSSDEPLLNDRIALRFSVPESAIGEITYVVEVSGNLSGSWTPLATKSAGSGWIWNPGGSSRIVLGTPTGGRIPVMVGDSQPATSAASRFLRLRAYFAQ